MQKSSMENNEKIKIKNIAFIIIPIVNTLIAIYTAWKLFEEGMNFGDNGLRVVTVFVWGLLSIFISLVVSGIIYAIGAFIKLLTPTNFKLNKKQVSLLYLGALSPVIFSLCVYFFAFFLGSTIHNPNHKSYQQENSKIETVQQDQAYYEE